MPTETIDLMVEAGKAAPNPAVAQKLGPLGINIGEVMNQVNKKTEPFKGMQVPVKIKIDTRAKVVSDIEVGTPPTTQLIKKELNLQKGSGQPDKEKIANISIEECIKVAKMKKDAMCTNNLKAAVKSVVGSCNSLGVLIEGKTASEIVKNINEGKFDKEILDEITQPSEEKKKFLKKQLEEVQKELSRALEKLKATEELNKEGKPKETEEKKEPETKETKAKETKEAKKEEKPKKEEKKK